MMMMTSKMITTNQFTSWFHVMKLQGVFTSDDTSQSNCCNNNVDGEDFVEGDNDVEDFVKGDKDVDDNVECNNEELVHVTVRHDEIAKGTKKLARCFFYF